ncbi:MAG: hypothetical protein VW891_13310, partial [Novosphingobium sp.]
LNRSAPHRTMDASIIAVLILLVILVVACVAAGRCLFALLAGAVGVALFACGGSPPTRREIAGGAEGLTEFCGEEVAIEMLPFLKAITSAPIKQVPETLSDLEVGPAYASFHPKVDAVLHYGQRKLLMSEVGFLSRYGHLSNEVVYVGAAPGTHIPYLAHLFPGHTFTLYDTRRFHLFSHPETKKRIKKVSRYFTDADAQALQGKGVLFISDIRLGDSDAAAAAAVATDKQLQRGWVETIRPAATSHKFRLPWPEGETLYFDAPLQIQAWAPGATNETRQEFEGVPPTKSWNNVEYDRRLNYLNAGLRQWAFYKGSLPAGVPGVDHCFDCAREMAIWAAYRKSRPTKAPAPGVADLMNGATESTMQRLDTPPHGVDPGTPMARKRKDLAAACMAKKFPCSPRVQRRKGRDKKNLKRRKESTQN